jgi:hypothetical protein
MLNRTLAFLAAVVAFLSSFGMLVYAAPDVLTVLYRRHSNPGDASAGDTAGWAMILVSPILLLGFLIFAGLVAIVTLPVRLLAVGPESLGAVRRQMFLAHVPGDCRSSTASTR